MWKVVVALLRWMGTQKLVPYPRRVSIIIGGSSSWCLNTALAGTGVSITETPTVRCTDLGKRWYTDPDPQANDYY